MKGGCHRSDIYRACVALTVCVCVLCLYVPVRQAYEHHSIEAERARYYLGLDVCSDALVSSALGPHNLCDESRVILSTPVFVRSVRTVVDGFLLPLCALVPRGVWVLAVLGALSLWCAIQSAGVRLCAPRVYEPKRLSA